MRRLLALLLLAASAQAWACPLCLSPRPSVATKLGELAHSVLVVPEGADGYRVIAVIKGSQRVGSSINVANVRFEAAVEKGTLLLARDNAWDTWTGLGAISAGQASFLREVAAGAKRATRLVADLESTEPLIAEIAYGELAAAPYLALAALKPRLSTSALRRWLADPALAHRQPLYLLLLGIAGDERDAVWLERRLETARTARDAANVGPMLAATLELRGPVRMAWVDSQYLADRRRTTPEIEAVLAALSVHGNANATIKRERVIRSYRLFMKEHPEIAGYVARDLAAWQYWDAVPEYAALLASDVRQQYPSRIAAAAYLRQSPGHGPVNPGEVQ